MTKQKIFAILPFVLVGFVLLAQTCFAVDIGSQLSKAGQGAYGADMSGTTSLPAMIGAIVKVVLGMLGIILVIIIIYAGYLYMTAGGDTKQLTKAKDFLKNAIIGIIIVVGAYAITDFVVTKMAGVISPTR
jgi:hypothetical protein